MYATNSWRSSKHLRAHQVAAVLFAAPGVHCEAVQHDFKVAEKKTVREAKSELVMLHAQARGG